MALGKQKKVLISVITAVLVFLITVILVFSMNNQPKKSPSPVNNLDIDSNAINVSDTSSIPQASTTNISIPGYKEIVVEANQKEVSVPFYNPKENGVYFVISLSLDDGTEIYESKLIEPGKGVNKITLLKPFKEGSYNAILSYKTFNLADKTPRNGANLKVKIIAE